MRDGSGAPGRWARVFASPLDALYAFLNLDVEESEATSAADPFREVTDESLAARPPVEMRIDPV